jgi:hypothetical protein
VLPATVSETADGDELARWVDGLLDALLQAVPR